MTAEFTGERVIPGEVDIDLWNEHVARYAFACQNAPGRRVLDMGCGAGYGSAMLLNSGASSVTSLDISPAALRLTTQARCESRPQHQCCLFAVKFSIWWSHLK